MKKIYVIKNVTADGLKYNSSAVTCEETAKAVCRWMNLNNPGDKFYYEKIFIFWNKTDISWLNEQSTELEMKELPY